MKIWATTTLLFLILFSFASNVFSQFLPQENGDLIVKHQYYTLAFDTQYYQAKWVAYEINIQSAFGSVQRTNSFKEDSLISPITLKSDYVNSGYDRGHLCPAGSMAFNTIAMQESFYMTNMSPQVPGFNRGIWKKLEAQVRTWGYENTHLHIITGPILNEFIDTIGEIPVPQYYYKVILDNKSPQIKGIAFLMENKSSTDPLQNYAVSIDSIESLTSLDFFPDLEDSLEQYIESHFEITNWSWKPMSLKFERITIEKKYPCLGYTTNYIQCKRTISNTNSLCWQHIKQKNDTVWVSKTPNAYYFTKIENAIKHCESGVKSTSLIQALQNGLQPHQE
jgi:endonuclease G